MTTLRSWLCRDLPVPTFITSTDFCPHFVRAMKKMRDFLRSMPNGQVVEVVFVEVDVDHYFVPSFVRSFKMCEEPPSSVLARRACQYDSEA